jgi:hypothetical protein
MRDVCKEYRTLSDDHHEQELGDQQVSTADGPDQPIL